MFYNNLILYLPLDSKYSFKIFRLCFVIGIVYNSFLSKNAKPAPSSSFISDSFPLNLQR
jgi:hypothetical protein